MAKEMYAGVLTDFPIYEEQEPQTISITESNISDYFIVTNGSYYFKRIKRRQK